MLKQATKQYEWGCEVTATILEQGAGLYTLQVINRFASGNFYKEEPIQNLSLVAAEGLLHFYTS